MQVCHADYKDLRAEHPALSRTSRSRIKDLYKSLTRASVLSYAHDTNFVDTESSPSRFVMSSSTFPAFGERGAHLGQILRRHQALARDSSSDLHVALNYIINNPTKTAVMWMADIMHNLGKHLASTSEKTSKLITDCTAAADDAFVVDVPSSVVSNPLVAKAELLKA